MENKWVEIKDGCEMPDYDVNVLCFYTIPHKDGVYEYYVIASAGSSIEGKKYKYYEWEDGEHNRITPTHWMPLPDKPKVLNAYDKNK